MRASGIRHRRSKVIGRGFREQKSEIGRDMRTVNVRIFVVLAVFLFGSRLFAQSTERPAYLNDSLSAEQRAADLVHRMTVEEKVSQLVNQSRAIPRLNVPDYDWWSESLHGVAETEPPSFPSRSAWPRPSTPMPFTAWPS